MWYCIEPHCLGETALFFLSCEVLSAEGLNFCLEREEQIEQITLQSLPPQHDPTLLGFTFADDALSVKSSTMSCSTGLVPWVIIKG